MLDTNISQEKTESSRKHTYKENMLAFDLQGPAYAVSKNLTKSKVA